MGDCFVLNKSQQRRVAKQKLGLKRYYATWLLVRGEAEAVNVISSQVNVSK